MEILGQGEKFLEDMSFFVVAKRVESVAKLLGCSCKTGIEKPARCSVFLIASFSSCFRSFLMSFLSFLVGVLSKKHLLFVFALSFSRKEGLRQIEQFFQIQYFAGFCNGRTPCNRVFQPLSLKLSYTSEYCLYRRSIILEFSRNGFCINTFCVVLALINQKNDT